MKVTINITFLAMLLLTASTGYGQIDITADKISNLEVTSGPFIPLYGQINYDSYQHNFLHNGTNIFSVGDSGLDLESNARITRQQSGGFKVDLLPFSMGTITRIAGQNAMISNDTGNFTTTGDDSGVITVTLDDSSINTSELVIHATPISTGITSASQVTIDTNSDNTFRIFLYTPSGASLSSYGVNITVYKP